MSENLLSSNVEMVNRERFFGDTSRLENIKLNSNDPESLNTVAKEFESIFLQMMIKSMRDSKKAFKSDIISSRETDSYEEMYDSQLALHLSENGGLGLADAVVRQFKECGNSTPISPAKAGASLREAENAAAQQQNNFFSKGTKGGYSSELHDPIGIKPEPISEQFATPDEFVKQLWPMAIKAAKSIGVDPKILLAQTALETGWGKKIAKLPDGTSSHNLFGIKADTSWNGKQVIAKTTECKDGLLVQQKDKFRAYNTFAASMQDYVKFIQGNVRYKGAMQRVDSPQKYMQALQNAGYATDPNYADKVLRVYRSETLHTLKDNT